MDFKNVKFDIIIQGGQSNAEGCGSGPVTQELIPSPNAFYLYAEKTVTVDEENLHITFHDKPFVIAPAKEREADNGVIVGDFSLSFADEYEKAGLLADDRKLLIIRAAVGGAGFQKKHWGLQDCLYLKLLELIDYALSLNEENRVVGFLWHQGEHDVFENKGLPYPELYKKYHADLLALFTDVKNKYSGDKFPFIAGGFVSEYVQRNKEGCAAVLQAMQTVCEEIKNAAVVSSEGLLSNNQVSGNGDDIHFCREALYELGKRYYEAYLALTGQA